MKRVQVLALFAVCVFCSLFGADAQAQEKPPAASKRYAVMTFNISDFGGRYDYGWWNGFRPGLVSSVSDMVTTAMVKSGFDVMERTRIDDILKEQDFQGADRVSPESAVKYGKLLGVQYLVLGTITQWGMSQRSAGGNFLPGPLRTASVREVTAQCVIDFRIVNVETGRIEAADAAEGREKQTSISLATDWYRGLSVQNNEWWGSQIGKATRRSANSAVAKMIGKKKDEMIILDMPTGDEIVVELDETIKVRKGDKLEVVRISRVSRNAQGKVILTQTELLGHAEVTEVQESGAVLRIIDRIPGTAEIKPGCLVKRKS